MSNIKRKCRLSDTSVHACLKGKPSDIKSALPATRKVERPGDYKAHAEAEDAVPPDDGVAEERTVAQQVHHYNARAECTACDDHGEQTVIGSLEYTEYGNIYRQHDVDHRDCLKMCKTVDRSLV